MPILHFYKGKTPSVPAGTLLKLGEHVLTGEKDFSDNFGPTTTLEVDLLTLSAAILAADRGCLRGEREDFSRSFELHVPVVNVGRLLPLATKVEEILRTLSNDNWTLNLKQENGMCEPAQPQKLGAGKVLLFSGGLDSLAAALEFSSENPPLALISHLTRNSQMAKAQILLRDVVEAKGANIEHHAFFVSSRNVGAFVHDAESSQRTRSFVFLTLAALSARRLNRREVVMIAENGQMAIHLPLNSARIGAFSTHTAHPEVLAGMQQFLRAALEIDISISNPYVFKTKREVIAPVIAKAPEAIAVSNSCWRSARLPSNASHCGECIPCFIRRIAVESYQPDPTAYARDVFKQNFGSLPPEDEGRRNLADLAEFTIKFETMSDAELLDEWPELFGIDSARAIEMYRRAAADTRKVLTRYKGGKQALQ
jgi:7-cyano-7-deazaguanine synthase in queuosine biosynthesis